LDPRGDGKRGGGENFVTNEIHMIKSRRVRRLGSVTVLKA
jgi:hypothetical protein